MKKMRVIEPGFVCYYTNESWIEKESEGEREINRRY